MRLPVLMYHKVSEEEDTGNLNVSPKQLEAQFRYLIKKGYSAISVHKLIRHISTGELLPKRPVLITFDDGYESHFLNVYPLLLKYNLRALIFLTAGFIQTDKSTSQKEYLHINHILEMNQEIVEYGLHTMSHESYDKLSLLEIEKDIESTTGFFSQQQIPFRPCLAYTYGAFPRKDKEKRIAVFRIFEKKGIQLAFRIGNRINKMPFKNKFLIQRIDVRGADSIWKFKLMCRFGRKWLPF